MYALADPSGATAMTRIIRRVGPRAKRLRAPNRKGAEKATSGILSLRSPNQLWRTRRKSALFPHCCRIATFFVPSLRCGCSLSCNMHARRFLFSTILTRRTLSVTNVTSLAFIFLMSGIRNADTFDRVFRACGLGVQEERRHVVAARHANITAAEHAPLPTTLSCAPRAQVLGYR